MSTDPSDLAPVITIDGPSGSGKGTVSLLLAKSLGWHMLDSGAIYRAVGWAVLHYAISPDNLVALEKMLKRIHIVVEEPKPLGEGRVFCDSHDITLVIREEACGLISSKVSALPIVRQAVLQYQRDFRRPPGLIADGRDMGTVVFPEASLKFFFEASPEERAQRRYKQLQGKGINVSLRDIREDLLARDRQDRVRDISPTNPASDAILIDTTNMTIETVLAAVLSQVKQRGLV